MSRNGPNMEEHIRALAVLNIILGALGVLAAMVIAVLFFGMAGMLGFDVEQARRAMPWIGMAVAATTVFLILVSLPAIIGGIGLLQHREWARILMIIVSALNLTNMPFGTALGIYGLWVLVQERTVALFERRPATPSSLAA